MASYRGHLSFSCLLGAAYGSAATWYWDMDWGPVFLGAGCTTLGGLLPDLDSDSGVPVREMFGLSAAAAPFLLYRRIAALNFTTEQTLVILAGLYIFIRYVLSTVFKHATIHRGIFHSIPAMIVAGEAVYLLYGSPDRQLRIFLAVGTMLGFLSHLILDEIYSVDFNGLTLRLNKFAGSALKMYSPSWQANAVCYALLLGLGYLCYAETL